MEEYYTHDNGGRPFKVQLQDDTARVFIAEYQGHNEEDSEPQYNKLIFTTSYQEAFVGYSRRNRMTLRSRSYGDDYDGNSILLRIKDLEYIFIGHTVFRFIALNTINKYESPVGNNDVPYPWARDCDGRYYLMIENVILTVAPPRVKNPYMYYYDNTNLGKKIVLTFENKSNSYRVSWQHDPCKHYDWLLSPVMFEENGENYIPQGLSVSSSPKMYLQCAGTCEDNVEFTELSKHDYVQLMRNHADQNGFIKLNTEIIQKRL
jgi:hypothetical protein